MLSLCFGLKLDLNQRERVKKLLWTGVMSIALAVIRGLGWKVGASVQVPVLLPKTRLILPGKWPLDGWVFGISLLL